MTKEFLVGYFFYLVGVKQTSVTSGIHKKNYFSVSPDDIRLRGS